MTTILIVFGTATVVALLMTVTRRAVSTRAAMRGAAEESLAYDQASRGVRGRCGACHAAIIEEDSVFCPKCGVRLGAGVSA